MDEYIEREKVYDIFGAKQQELLKYYRYYQLNDADKEEFDLYDSYMNEVERIPAADVVEVVHGEWVLETHSFYVDTWDESAEFAVYITANCSKCDRKHPDGHEVYSKRLYAPEDADENFRFDKEAEELLALKEFRQRKYDFAKFCPNCGAKMR